MNIESKQVVVSAQAQKVYDFVGDFNNLSRIIPTGNGQISNFSCTADRCSFNVGGFMQITLTYLERTPYSQVVLGPAADASSPMSFKLKVNIKSEGMDSSRLTLSFDMEGGNMMMNMMLKPKLKDAADKMAEMLQYYCNAL